MEGGKEPCVNRLETSWDYRVWGRGGDEASSVSCGQTTITRLTISRKPSADESLKEEE